MDTTRLLGAGDGAGPQHSRCLPGALLLALQAAVGMAHASGGPCSDTAQIQFAACGRQAEADLLTARAACNQIGGATARAACLAEAKTVRREDGGLCNEQRRARLELCEALGDTRYEPDFDPAHFQQNPAQATQPNPYFPLAVGHRWQYAGGDETVDIEVLAETKRIEGVNCIVVNDRAAEDGAVVEDTDDWFGLREDGTVDYCGEIAQNFELFPGDRPRRPELVDVAGSWKAGRDGAQSGTLFPGHPDTGQVYRQEFAPGIAEDAARVLSTQYGYGNDPELDALVPPQLARIFCRANDCVVTAEFTPIEPDAFERKYYAPGIGMFLAVNPAQEEVVQLVGCNFDARCARLPQP